MPATIAFWNVQRVGNPKTKDWQAALRYGLVFSTLKSWCSSDDAPDVLMLCEVSDSGAEMAKDLESTIEGYTADFVPTKSMNCNFLVMIKGGSKMGKKSITPIGESSRRYLVFVEITGLKVAAIHATADRGDKAREDAIDAMTELAKEGAYLIGDMNIAYGREFEGGDMTVDFLMLAQQMGWTPVPAPYATHRGKTLLDYLWVPFGGKAEAAKAPKWTDWEVIDHAPVCFAVK